MTWHRIFCFTMAGLFMIMAVLQAYELGYHDAKSDCERYKGWQGSPAQRKNRKWRCFSSC